MCQAQRSPHPAHAQRSTSLRRQSPRHSVSAPTWQQKVLISGDKNHHGDRRGLDTQVTRTSWDRSPATGPKHPSISPSPWSPQGHLSGRPWERGGSRDRRGTRGRRSRPGRPSPVRLSSPRQDFEKSPKSCGGTCGRPALRTAPCLSVPCRSHSRFPTPGWDWGGGGRGRYHGGVPDGRTATGIAARPPGRHIRASPRDPIRSGPVLSPPVPTSAEGLRKRGKKIGSGAPGWHSGQASAFGSRCDPGVMGSSEPHIRLLH